MIYIWVSYHIWYHDFVTSILHVYSIVSCDVIYIYIRPRLIINSSPSSESYMRQWTGSLLRQVIAWTCSAPSHYLNICWLIANWTHRNKLLWNLNQNTKIFYSWKCIRKCWLRNGVHFVQWEMSYILPFSAVACERYLGTFWPLRYKELVTLKRVGLVFCFCIAYPGISVMPFVAMFNSWKPNILCVFFAISPLWLLIFITVHVFLCILVMAMIYVSIIRRALQLQKQVTHFSPCRFGLGKLKSYLCCHLATQIIRVVKILPRVR